MARAPLPRKEKEITLLLKRWKSGDDNALIELMPLIRADLLRRARRYLAGEQQGNSLSSSDVIQEAWMDLRRQKNVSYQSRSDFCALASTIMPHVLVDHARSKRAKRRGGGMTRVTLGSAGEALAEPLEDVLVLHEALKRLELEDQRKASILDMYYFGGLTIEEISAGVGLAVATVHKHKTIAEARVREIGRRGGRADGG